MLRVALAGMLVLSSAGVAHAAEEKAPAEKPPEKVRGPAHDLVVEAGFGYGVSALTAIDGHDPKVSPAPAVHFGAGWAWSIKSNQSVGLELFVDGSFDGDKVTGDGTKFARRLGAAAFVVGERAHVRLGGGFSKSYFDKGEYDGLGIVFAAGWHFAIIKDLQTWKRPMMTIDFMPSWDFLGAGTQTLHRPSFALVLGIAAY
ncbi:MAG: hypothetical protein ACXVEE_11170 [Polyangiales bacterium]